MIRIILFHAIGTRVRFVGADIDAGVDAGVDARA